MSLPHSWHPSRDAALDTLQRFLPRAGSQYAKTRNFDHGPHAHDNVSCLSPWLRRRLLLEEEVIARVVAEHDRSSAEKFIQEVYWRTYFKGWLEQHPDAWFGWLDQLSRDQALLDDDRALRERWVQAVAARTGIDCFDAWATELVQTGYLHNHARMWFASIWIFTLQLPWSLGAAFFYEHLLDADPASNTLSWRWVGGLHTRGKHYLARAENIAKFTGGRFHPQGQLNTQAEPLEEPPEAQPERVPLDPPPAPLRPERSRVGLLITEEDVDVTTLPLAMRPCALGGLCGALPGEPPRGPAQLAFADGAVRDGLQRASEHFQLEACELGGEHTLTTLRDWAQEQSLDAIVVPWQPVGPCASVLQAAQDAGLALHRVRRDYDSLAWPHAKAGFFGLKKRIPALLDALSA